MKPRQFLFLPVAIFILLTPKAALATVRYVAHTTAECGSLTPCYTSIQTAINNSVTLDSIEIQASDTPYTGNIILPTNLADVFSITIYGTETARTILSGGGTGTVITADNPLTAVGTLTLNLRNVTIISATTGIQAKDKISVIIRNNVFHGLSTAINTVNPQSTVEITNNTFYNNGTAINRDTTNHTIKNNIFASNSTAAISLFSTTNLSTNNYFSNGDDATIIRETTAVSCDPSFANITNGDFHLQAGATCCIDKGDPSAGNDPVGNPLTDIGAYGGSQSDTIPFPVSGVTATASGTTVRVEWTPNPCYAVIGYNVYHRAATASSYVTPADNATTSPLNVSGLAPAGVAPATPALVEPMDFANQTLKPVWNFVSGATGYKLHYGIASTAENTIDVGNVNTYDIQGLTNGTWYRVAVSAYTQSTYYFVVTAYDSATSTPGVSHESAYSSPEIPAVVGTALESPLSTPPVLQYPEAINAYPNLPDKGCFIATAAYGYYSAPQVRALRKFRDEYLLTNAGGRAFVRWYYEHGPRAARFIDEHPSLKPAVRAALLPAVGGAMFLTGTSGPVKTIVAFCLMTGMGYLLYRYRRKFTGAGGRQ